MNFEQLKKHLILYIVFTQFELICFGQIQFKKEYCGSGPSILTGFCLTFENDSAFKYNSWYCNGGSSGDGIYKMDSKKLILKFRNTDTIYRSYAKIKDMACGSKDSIFLKFLVVCSETNNPLPFIEITINKNYKNVSTATNENGEAFLKVKKSDTVANLTVNSTATKTFKNYMAKIDLENCKDFKIKLKRQPFNSYNYDVFDMPDEDVKTYQIKNIGLNSVLLMQDKSEYQLEVKDIER